MFDFNRLTGLHLGNVIALPIHDLPIAAFPLRRVVPLLRPNVSTLDKPVAYQLH